jgi:hypothetical protein
MPFFTPTSQSLTRFTKLYDFVWTASMAIWRTGEEISTFAKQNPGVSENDLVSRFVSPATTRRQITVRKNFIETTHAQHEQELSHILLVNAFAIYEAWLEDLLDVLRENTKQNVKGLQFPTSPDGTKGVGPTLQRLLTNSSAFSTSAFLHGARRHRRYRLVYLEPMLICYRFFKEARNALMHHGGEVTPSVGIAASAYANVANVTAMGMPKAPPLPQLTVGTPLVIPLTPVINFVEVMLRLMVTIDAELTAAPLAEQHFVERWKAYSPKRIDLPRREEKRLKWLTGALVNLGFPNPTAQVSVVDDYLRRNGFTFY